MSSENTKILKQLINQKLRYEELVAKGFKDDTIVSHFAHNDGLFIDFIYIKKRFYEGVTLEVEENKWFTFSSNDFNKEEVERENKIVDMQSEIEMLNNNIIAYRFEFDWFEQADELERKKRILKANIKTIRLKDKLRYILAK